MRFHSEPMRSSPPPPPPPPPPPAPAIVPPTRNGSPASVPTSTPQNGVVPQMVLTSGQVAEGVQGAQLLIPTSQGKILKFLRYLKE